MNTWQFTPYALLYILAVAISYMLAYLAWKMRPVRGAAYFSLLTLATGTWSLGALLGFFNTDLGWKLIMLRVEYLGIIGTAFLWLLFVAAYTQFDQWLTRRAIALLAVVPVVAYILILTVQHHNLFYRSYGLTTGHDLILFTKVYGPGFYIMVGYGYILLLSGIVILFRVILRMPDQFRGQIRPLILAVVVILLSNALYVSGNNPIQPYDPTPLSFAVAGVLCMIAMRSYRFLDVVPVAHNLVFKNVNNGVIIIDRRGQILDMNPAAEHILNRTSEEALGKSAIDIFPEHTDLIKRFRDVLEVKTEIEQDSRSYELQITPLTDHSQKPVGRIITLYDLTERKQAEKEHLELMQERQRVEVLQHFISAASHDLRTPLTTMKTSLFLLKSLNDPEKRKKHMAMLESQTEHLERLLEDMLTLSRLDKVAELEFAPLNLKSLFGDIMRRQSPLIAKKKLSVEVAPIGDLPFIQGDGHYLSRALEIVVLNALNYTPDGGEITARLCEQEQQILIEVQDSGIGISEKDLPHIFESFYRGDKARNTNTGGTGLGLAMAQKIVELHHGSIEVESKLEQGSMFRIYLPTS